MINVITLFNINNCSSNVEHAMWMKSLVFGDKVVYEHKNDSRYVNALHEQSHKNVYITCNTMASLPAHPPSLYFIYINGVFVLLYRFVYTYIQCLCLIQCTSYKLFFSICVFMWMVSHFTIYLLVRSLVVTLDLTYRTQWMNRFHNYYIWHLSCCCVRHFNYFYICLCVRYLLFLLTCMRIKQPTEHFWVSTPFQQIANCHNSKSECFYYSKRSEQKS